MCRRGRLVVSLLSGVMLSVIGFAGTAGAHTGFDSSTPSDGDVVEGPLTEIIVRFTGEATPAGEGFAVLDADGVVRSPSSISTDDDKVFVLGFEPPLTEGVIGVRWEVQARDAHPISGSFSFTISAPPATTEPPVTAVTSTSPAAPATSAPTTAPVPTTTATGSVPATPAPSESTTAGDTTSLEEFLDTDTDSPGGSRQLAGRILGLLGVLGAVGGIAFMATTLRGTSREFDALMMTVGAFGLLAALGGGLELWGLVVQNDVGVGDAVTSTPGAAMALRIVGGVAVAAGVLLSRRFPATSGRALLDASPDTTVTASGRWAPSRPHLLVGGAAIVAVSFWFDGHTVTRGPRVVHALVNTVHVVAASVWAGGVVLLTAVLWARHRRRQPGRAAELIVRFSTVASLALGAVVAAGALMAVFVLDDPGDLTSTEWGQTLILKSSAAGLAALGGAYNHFRLRPALEARPDDRGLEAEFRSTLIAEAVVLTFVAVVTAWLVEAAI